MNAHLYYLFFILLCCLFPVIYLVIHSNFRKKNNINIIAPTVIWASVPYLIWDMVAKSDGQWQFNPRYISGVYFFNIPMEEVLFFIFIPQSCLFIWVILNKYPSWNDFRNFIFHHLKKNDPRIYL